MKVVFFPRDKNPYQDLLVAALQNLPRSLVPHPPNPSPASSPHRPYAPGPVPSPIQVSWLDPSLKKTQLVPSSVWLLYRLATFRLTGHTVLHIHWLYLGFPKRLPFSPQLSFLYAAFFLLLARALGYRLVWTAHNVLPHAPITGNDRALTRLLVRLAGAVIVHSAATIGQMRERQLDTGKCRIIPHGNYQDVFPNTVSRTEARKQLGIPDKALVVGFFGAIEPYKNVPALLRAFDALAPRLPRAYLLIAGACRDPQARELLTRYAAKYPGRLSLHDRFIPDDAVQLYLNAADVMAFPFTAITTSGSVILAATFGKPVVAPRIGALADVPSEMGVLYEPDKPDALQEALDTVLTDGKARSRMARAAMAYGDSLDWGVIAMQTARVYTELKL